MSVLPNSNSDKLQFLTVHVPVWTSNAVAIGSSADKIALLETKADAARAAFDAQKAAQAAAKAATLNLRVALDAAMLETRSVIKQIKAKADTDGQGIYALAEIPAPATPEPAGLPGKPERLVATLDDSGFINLQWKCPNPSGMTGVMYQVSRRINPDGVMQFLGGTGQRRFVDSTVPAGATNITYQIQGLRSTGAGPNAQFNVNFGMGAGSGVMTASVTPVKLAA